MAKKSARGNAKRPNGTNQSLVIVCTQAIISRDYPLNDPLPFLSVLSL